MPTFALILTLISGDPETGPIHEFVVDYNLTHEDCLIAKEEFKPLWLGNNNIGMSCHEEPK